MAKPVYKIPTSLESSFLDHEIAIPIFGIQPRPMPIKQLLTLVFGSLAIIWISTQTFIASAHFALIALFIIWAFITLLYLGGLTPTKEMRFSTLPALVSYLPKRSRRVLTRRSSNPSDFYSIVGIDSIDKTGLIRFSDGGYGQAYLTVGSASYLLFDEDRDAILNRVDDFWRKLQPGSEFISITTKEPQRIYHQLAHLERRNQNLEVRDPDLLELQDEQHDILVDHVGGKFNSIHQYTVLKSKTFDGLQRAHSILQAEVEASTLMIKGLTMLDQDETEQMLAVMFRGIDDPLPGAAAR